MADLVGGSLLGAVAGELLKAVIDVAKKAVQFKEQLERLKSTLENILPRIEEVQRLHGQITDLKTDTDIERMIQELKEGQVRVRKCEKISSWNYYKKYRYSKMFIKLDESLCRFFQLNVQADAWLDNKKLLVEFKEMSRKFEAVSFGDTGPTWGFISAGSESIGSQELNLCAVPELPSLTVGLDVPLKELKMMLLRKDVKVLVLCAPGGCGKTTLATMLCQDEQVKGLFKENIFFLTVSSSPNLKVLIQRLFEQISGRSPPEFQNDEDAIKQLGDLFKKRKQDDILLVLDDVWSVSVIEKLDFKKEGFKMLVTSRTEFNAFRTTYFLKMLNDRDAMTLFCHEAFPQDENANSERPEEELIEKIVRACKGYPLTLKVIGHSLRWQNPRKWRQTEKILSTSCSIFKDHSEDLLDRLSTSLSFLKDTARECFLDFGSFPEDQRIPASALIDIWIELHKLDGEDDVYANLLELSQRNLINLIECPRNDAGDLDGTFNGLYVFQHDLLRDLAIYQSQQHQQDIKHRKRLLMERRDDDLPRSWWEQEHQHINACLVSILTGEMCSSSWHHMQLPESVVLILDFLGMNYSLPPFMESMGKLKVLIVTNHGHRHAKLGNLSALGYLAELKRIRLEKISLPSLDSIIMSLKNLHKISLVMCDVGEASRNCTVKIQNMLPNLTEIDIDYCNDLVELPPGICSIHLQKLSITNCHNLSTIPDNIGFMTGLEVLRLHACTGILELPDSIRRLQKLRFLDISDCSNIERLPEGMSELCSLKTVDMRRCLRVRVLPSSVLNLQNLKDVICDEETASLWEPLRIHLTKLKIKVPEDHISLDWLGIDLRSHNFY
ncbi:PREDICTED: probable disease resistance protein At5g66900 [Nelumbo nucifera]|uniref:RPW8 domain-containing protein n=2 Tax=Nelumbo nucifera TaxID=4432 RepID=A0A822ZBW7_NELNU|nr:PREDICTED: probable disease resistance protein At5g66900 [Nelumbo nucifera]DAD40526.1 TPA_asm: hypothetical protein HUJ06_014849 [Nelumbo nucifera]